MALCACSRPRKPGGEMSMQSDAVVVEQVSHHYGAQVALDQVDLRLPMGRTCGLGRARWVGKSTLLALIAGCASCSRAACRYWGRCQPGVVSTRSGAPRGLHAARPGAQSVPAFVRVRQHRLFGSVVRVPAAERDARIQRLMKATALDPFMAAGEGCRRHEAEGVAVRGPGA